MLGRVAYPCNYSRSQSIFRMRQRSGNETGQAGQQRANNRKISRPRGRRAVLHFRTYNLQIQKTVQVSSKWLATDGGQVL